jgi:hypothetical protein
MSSNNPHLGTFLSAAVPLRIRDLQSRGGPSKEDMESLREYSKLLGEHGESLLFKSKKKGETAQMANGLASAVAILSFVPGGLTLFDQHWETICE